MALDPRSFTSPAVVDTCAIWNLLSSRKFFNAAVRAQNHFLTTDVVRYECLTKPRTNSTAEQDELIRRYRAAEKDGHFPTQSCTLEDVLLISSQAPSALGSGEISCIAAAYRIRSIAFMTDEKRARAFSERLGIKTETTPRLYCWLHYHQHLGDADHSPIIEEHERYERRPLTKFFDEAYQAAMRARLFDSTRP